MRDLERTLQSNEFIGVHCTHGINRTGYMIANYMCREKGVKPRQAINAFEKSREPHKIDKDYLIQDLKKKYRTKRNVDKKSTEDPSE